MENTLAIAIKLPLYVVGPATAALGRELGFTDVRGGGGAAVELADRILADFAPGQGPLVHLAGDHLAGDLRVRLSANGFGLIERVVYQSRAATALSQTCIGAFKAGQIGGVILLSPRTAVLYAGLIAAHGLLDCMRGVAHFCISQAVAAQLEPLHPVEIAIAPRPNLDEVLALVKGRAGTQQSG